MSEGGGPVARRIVVSGRVQGVFFRDSLREQAERHGVVGWVRNRDDGTVEAHLEGGADEVSAVEEWCSSGPSRADVSGVDAEDASSAGLSGFEVR